MTSIPELIALLSKAADHHVVQATEAEAINDVGLYDKSIRWHDSQLRLIRAALRALALADTPLPQLLTNYVRDHERTYVQHVLFVTKGNMTAAARMAGRNRTEFYRMVAKHGIKARHFREGAV